MTAGVRAADVERKEDGAESGMRWRGFRLSVAFVILSLPFATLISQARDHINPWYEPKVLGTVLLLAKNLILGIGFAVTIIFLSMGLYSVTRRLVLGPRRAVKEEPGQITFSDDEFHLAVLSVVSTTCLLFVMLIERFRP